MINNNMQHYVQNNTTLTIHSNSVRRMQECYKKSTNFGQSQWLIKDLSTQRGGVRSDSQKGGQNLHLIEDSRLQ